MTKPDREVLLTPTDVAERCQISTKTVLRAIRSGRLCAYRLGARGAYRMRSADVEECSTRATSDRSSCRSARASRCPRRRRRSTVGCELLAR
jgi:excisionase family DNA binding protein